MNKFFFRKEAAQGADPQASEAFGNPFLRKRFFGGGSLPPEALHTGGTLKPNKSGEQGGLSRIFSYFGSREPRDLELEQHLIDTGKLEKFRPTMYDFTYPRRYEEQRKKAVAEFLKDNPYYNRNPYQADYRPPRFDPFEYFGDNSGYSWDHSDTWQLPHQAPWYGQQSRFPMPYIGSWPGTYTGFIHRPAWSGLLLR